MDKMELKGAIFDMDGTLLDSMKYWSQLDERYLKKRGIEYNHEISDYLKTCSLRMAAEFLKKEFNLPDEIKEIEEEIIDGMREPYEKLVTAKDGAIELLELFKEKNVRMSIATSTERDVAKKVLARLDMLKYFDDVLSCSDIGKNKDYPDIFHEAMRIMGTEKDDTVVFEDSYYAIKTAKENRFRVAVIEDDSAIPEREDIKMLADIYGQNPADLIKYFD